MFSLQLLCKYFLCNNTHSSSEGSIYNNFSTTYWIGTHKLKSLTVSVFLFIRNFCSIEQSFILFIISGCMFVTWWVQTFNEIKTVVLTLIYILQLLIFILSYFCDTVLDVMPHHRTFLGQHLYIYHSYRIDFFYEQICSASVN